MSLSYPDIQLIRPPAVESFRFATTSITLPIGLAYISSSLKKYGFKVEILDTVQIQPAITQVVHSRIIVPNAHEMNLSTDTNFKWASCLSAIGRKT